MRETRCSKNGYNNTTRLTSRRQFAEPGGTSFLPGVFPRAVCGSPSFVIGLGLRSCFSAGLLRIATTARPK
jgi:hypothetical protein